MASIIDRLKKSAVKPIDPLKINPITRPVGGLVATGASIANKVLSPIKDVPQVNMSTPTGPAIGTITAARKPTQASTQVATPTTTAAVNRQIVTPIAQTTTPTAPQQGRSFSAASAGEFKSLYGRDPKGQELMDFVAGTFKPTERPITPAPTTLTDGSIAGDASELGIATKLLKQQYGDTFTESEYALLAQKQLDKPKADLTGLETATQAQRDILASQSAAATQAQRDEEARLATRREEQLAATEASLRAQAERDIEEAQRLGRETQTTDERLLGARGNLTSAVGANRIQDIQRQTSNTINAVNAAVDAKLAYEKAQLEGADEATLRGLADRYQAAKDTENQFIFESETALQQAKLQAEQAGDQAFLDLVQSSLDSLGVQKVAAKADAALTKNIGDGYVYDEFGQRVSDAEGNFVTYESPQQLDEFMNVGGNLFNKTTGSFITAPGQTTTPGGVQLPSGANEQEVAKAERILSLSDELLNSDIAAITGVIGGRVNLTQNSRDSVIKLNTLKDLLTLDNLGLMKGVLTDRDIQLLASAASSLEKTGSEDLMRTELNRIKTKAAEGIFNAAGFNDVTFEQALQQAGSIDELIGASKQEIENQKQQSLSFNSPAGTGSTTLRDGMRASTPFGSAVLTGVERGSDKWQYGLDLVIEGGKGAPVPSPVTGTVVSAGKDGGFGNSVQVQLADGRRIRLSHLDAMNVKPGQQIRQGQPVGTQGNTGSVYSLSGGDGTHLDVTIYDQNGNPYSSQQVAQLLRVQSLA